ncbi:membrane-spanning 4-domains subfamily A member 4A-like [Discoglossus pictus]
MPEPLRRFYSGEPEVLGVIHISTGAFQLVFGISLSFLWWNTRLPFDVLAIFGTPFWSGALYIISGSLSVAAFHKPTIGKVRAVLVLSIFSTLASAYVIIMSVSVFLSLSLFFRIHGDNVSCSYHKPNQACEGVFHPKIVVFGMLLLPFVFNVLEFCISISTSAFGCKTVCRTSYSDMNVVIYQNNSTHAGESAADTATAVITALTEQPIIAPPVTAPPANAPPATEESINDEDKTQ